MYLTTSSSLWSRRCLDGVLADTVYFGALCTAACEAKRERACGGLYILCNVTCRNTFYNVAGPFPISTT